MILFSRALNCPQRGRAGTYVAAIRTVELLLPSSVYSHVAVFRFQQFIILYFADQNLLRIVAEGSLSGLLLLSSFCTILTAFFCCSLSSHAGKS